MTTDHTRDEAMARLAQHDPAHAEPDDAHLAQLRARVLARADGEASGSVTPLRRSGRALRITAAAAALVVVAGAAGAVGRATAPDDLAALTMVPSGNAPGGMTSASEMGGGDAALRGAGGWWGPTVLEPAPDLSDEGGTAPAYTYDNSDVDPQALAGALADAMGATATVTGNATGGWSLAGSSSDGGQFTGWVGVDAMASFSGYVDVRSPWYCPPPASGAGMGAVEPGSSGGAVSEPMPACTPTPMTAPSEQDAIAQVRSAFERLGLDVDNARFTALTYESTVQVSAWIVVDQQVLPTTWNAEVSSRGLVSISGHVARLVALGDYPVVGARTAALRSQDARWSGLGPTWAWRSEGAAVDMPREPVVAPDERPQVRTVNGRPVLTSSVSITTVTDATMGIAQYWLADGRPVLLPAWQYTATDGSRWAMLAITDEYVDLQRR